MSMSPNRAAITAAEAAHEYMQAERFSEDAAVKWALYLDALDDYTRIRAAHDRDPWMQSLIVCADPE